MPDGAGASPLALSPAADPATVTPPLREAVARAMLAYPAAGGLKALVARILGDDESGIGRTQIAALAEAARHMALRLSEWRAGPAALAWGAVAYLAARDGTEGWTGLLPLLLRHGAAAQSGLTESPFVQGAEAPAIPRRILQCRPDHPRYDADLARRVSWAFRNPGHRYDRFSEGDARGFLARTYGDRMVEAYDALPAALTKADLLGLAALYDHGGIYVDVFDFALGPVDLMLPPGARLVLTWNDGHAPLANKWFIAAAPRHPLIGRLLQAYLRRIEGMQARGEEMTPHELTGREALTLTLLDDWCARGGWPPEEAPHFIANADYRVVAEHSHEDEDLPTRSLWRFDTIRAETLLPTETPATAARATGRGLGTAATGDRVETLRPAVVLPPGRPLVILSSRQEDQGWQHQRLARFLAPAARVHWLHDITVSGPGCLWRKGLFVKLDSYLSHVAETEARDSHWKTPAERAPAFRVEEPVILAFGPGYGCYGHWLVDELPRLALAREALGEAFEHHKLLMPRQTPAWGKALLAHFFGIGEDRLISFDMFEETVELAQAVVPGYPHRAYLLHPFLRDGFLRHAPLDARPHRRICLSRRGWERNKAHQRIFEEQEQFEEAAAGRGFDLVQPQEMSIADQIRLMAETAVQIGEHGSAQHASIFSPFGTVVGSINPLTPVQIQLGRLSDDDNILLFPDRSWESGNSSTHFSCPPDKIADFLDAVERAAEARNRARGA